VIESQAKLEVGVCPFGSCQRCKGHLSPATDEKERPSLCLLQGTSKPLALPKPLQQLGRLGSLKSMRARYLPLGRALVQLPEAWTLGASRQAAAAAPGARCTATAAVAAAEPSAAAAPLLKEVLVYRWSPEKGETPKYDSFTVDLSK